MISFKSGYRHIPLLLTLFLHVNQYCYSQINEKRDIVFQKLPPDFEYNIIRCILKDHKGYMWFGTDDGLVRFDGINVYTYVHDPDNPNSIRHNTVNSLAEDEYGNLWVGTSLGLFLYNRETDNFMRVGEIYPDLVRLNSNFVSYLYYHENRLWVCTYGDGINIYNVKERSIEHLAYNPQDPNSLSSNQITCVAVDGKHNIWAGTQNGLNLFDKETRSFRQIYADPGNSKKLSNNNITTLTVDPEGNLWIGTKGGGLNRLAYNKGEPVFHRITVDSKPINISNNFVLSLITSPDGDLWIGTENGGLNRINPATRTIEIFKTEEGNDASISSNSIWSLYFDNENRLWIGTYNSGINVIDRKYSRFDSYKKNIVDPRSLPDNNVKAFAEDYKGKIWIATDGGGICRFDPLTNSFDRVITNSEQRRYISDNSVQTVISCPDKSIWIGTWGGGIDRLDSEGVRIRNYEVTRESGTGNNNIFTLYADEQENIWVGTAGSGLFICSKNTDKFLPAVINNSSSVINIGAYVSAIFEDSPGTLWIGTMNGISVLQAAEDGGYHATDITRARFPSLNSNAISCIFKDSRGRLWFGTGDNGIARFNRHDSTFISFRKEDGLPGNTIRGILEDHESNLWILTNKGLSKFHPDSGTFVNYTKEDGLNSNELNIQACLKANNGRFYLGGEGGFNVFRPENIKNNDYVPPVYLTDFKINNKSVTAGSEHSPLKKHISETASIKLNHRQSSFSIDFVALNYTRSAKNQYCYKLEGFEDDWNYIGNQKSAIYTNILPGKYIFKVKGSNNDGIWNEKPTELKITITRPFWKTIWARLIYLLIFICAVYFVLIIRNERSRIKNMLKVEQLAREKEHELNELNIQFFTNISHEFRTPLSLILGPLEGMISSEKSDIREKLMVIYRNARRLLQLTNNLMDIRKLEEGISMLKIREGDYIKFINQVVSFFKVNAASHHIDFKVKSQLPSITGWFDPEKLETILMNLLSNAFKYVPDHGRVHINVRVMASKEYLDKFGIDRGKTISDSDYIEIKVIDNGSGISAEELPYIFDKFYQANSSGKSGTGIGLTLTKGLVEMHHGMILAESIPGTETCFTIILPVDRSAYQNAAIVTENENNINSDLFTISGSANEKDIPDPGDIVEKPTILIAEDNDELRDFLIRELGAHFRIIDAENGSIGIDQAFSQVPDLIISDILMPFCSGIELCRTIKSDIRTSHIPVILLTAKNSLNDQIEGVETGAEAYITKPFNMQFLLSVINQLIKTRRELYARFSQDVYMMPGKITNNSLDREFIQKAIDYIVRNVSDNTLNVEGLSDFLNLSRSNVYRKIKALTGKTIIEFIRTIRLKQAIILMESKKHTLAEIAYLTGFTSPAYFTKSFKDQYGKPPSEYMNSVN